ncbi:protein serine/threonine kinase, putative [Entamoeba invadens IP1]|uniref:Protein serine/threonine kinase, putative n=1 Tax=Entamoeba invadens IP1 TaxID=370355 RepID=A0A0A1UFY0_ENTIV|nr:protein serine/threonine kinase, putative [Entamoeba invadens IP1]ELP92024.1 protein serine/threonine kinase, putative [Entamoeba invadens IP1]|eukprot:XP_004258795.1 protein serine/threonine kinase, putative [Entamoeba invadens IP1]
MNKQTNLLDIIDEFEKEIVMLDKFRNAYVVHFNGAVFVTTKICIVTEYADLGSLHQGSWRTVKRILYVHINGIFHLNIKPDNIFSFEENVTVNGKLTDFGSSRNISIQIKKRPIYIRLECVCTSVSYGKDQF